MSIWLSTALNAALLAALLARLDGLMAHGATTVEAKTGYGYLGDIAIDDISYSGCDTG